MRSRLWHLFIIVPLLSFTSESAIALNITSSSVSPVYAGQADSATLNCHFTLSDQDVGPIDIEWSLKSPDVQREEKTVIWYAVDQIYASIFKPFEG